MKVCVGNQDVIVIDMATSNMTAKQYSQNITAKDQVRFEVQIPLQACMNIFCINGATLNLGIPLPDAATSANLRPMCVLQYHTYNYYSRQALLSCSNTLLCIYFIPGHTATVHL